MVDYPPPVPPATRTDSTTSAVTHALDHNELAAGLAAIITILGADPEGGYADLTARLADYLTTDQLQAIATTAATTAASAAASATVPGLVTASLAANNAPATAAAAAVASALASSDVLVGGIGDERVPFKVPTTTAYARVWTDVLDKIALGIRGDGSVYAPLLAFDKFVTTDQRLPTLEDGYGGLYARAWVDVANRIAAAIRSDGKFYAPSSVHDTANIGSLIVGSRTTAEAYEATVITDVLRATVDVNGRIGEDVLNLAGRQPLWVTQAQFSRLTPEEVARKAGIAAVPANVGAVIDRRGDLLYETSDPLFIEEHGDSITQAPSLYDSENLGGWAGRLNTDLAAYGITGTNQGLAARTSTDLAIRDGVVVPLVTVAGGSIPASGSVACTITPATSYRYGSTGVFTFAGTLAGVPGTLQRDVSVADQPSGWSFIRTASGAVTPAPAGTPFMPSAPALLNPRAIIISNYGRNNIYYGDDVIRDTIALRNRLTPARPKMLTLSVLTTTTETGTGGYASVLGINARLAALAATGLWGYFDVRRWLIDNALTYLGLTPTTQDLANIAADTLPPQIMADATHPNYLGFRAMKYAIRQELVSRGWVPA